jgi:hypothetical protein
MKENTVGKLILLALVALLGMAIAAQLPELQRYLKIRSM